jgi:hypothetical protein
MTSNTWLDSAKNLIDSFAQTHQVVVRSSERAVSAAFEIGCLHSLLKFYEAQGFSSSAVNLGPGKEYRYLTTPAGNPANFSYIRLVKRRSRFELRQQVRIQSSQNRHVRFTPDLVVIRTRARISGRRSSTYASGRRRFYYVTADQVVAAHECKSTNPFPELLVSFVGMFQLAHAWVHIPGHVERSTRGDHLAPTLFVGGSLSPFHEPMVKALQRMYLINIVTGLHAGTWNIGRSKNRLRLRRDANRSTRPKSNLVTKTLGHSDVTPLPPA